MTKQRYEPTHWHGELPEFFVESLAEAVDESLCQSLRYYGNEISLHAYWGTRDPDKIWAYLCEDRPDENGKPQEIGSWGSLTQMFERTNGTPDELLRLAAHLEDIASDIRDRALENRE